jgi:hypothetical protein
MSGDEATASRAGRVGPQAASISTLSRRHDFGQDPAMRAETPITQQRCLAQAARRAMALMVVAALLLATGWGPQPPRMSSAQAWSGAGGSERDGTPGPVLAAKDKAVDGFFLPRVPGVVTAIQLDRPAPPAPEPTVLKAAAVDLPAARDMRPDAGPRLTDACVTGPRTPRTPTGPPVA